MDLEVGNRSAGDVRQGKRDGTAVTVFFGAVGEVGPPGLLKKETLEEQSQSQVGLYKCIAVEIRSYLSVSYVKYR